MAQTMTCDGCNQIEAVLMVTQIGTGEIQAFCPGCTIVWAEGIAAALRTTLGLPDTDTETDLEWEGHAQERADRGEDPYPDPTDTAGPGTGVSDTTHDPTSTADTPAGATMGAGQPAPAGPTQEG